MSQLRKVMGVTGDRVWVESAYNGHNKEHEELTLYVNGGGSLVALSPAQAELQGQQAQPSPAESPKAKEPQEQPATDQPLNPNEPS